MPRNKPINEVRGALDEMNVVMRDFIADNFESVGGEVRRYDPQRLLKYLRDQLLGKFVDHVSRTTELESREAENLAKTLIHMALQIRNQSAHFDADTDPLQIDTPVGAIAAIGCLRSLTRVFGVNDASTEVKSMDYRIRQLAAMHLDQIETESDVGDDSLDRKRKRPSSPTIMPAASSFQLVVVSALHKNRRINLDIGLLPVILGRDPDDLEQRIVDLREYVESPDSISRLHCEISAIDSSLYVQDLGSTNGTLLNGLSIHTAKGTQGKPHIYKAGDVLCLGDAVELKLLRKGK
jgi:hypothetical protein